MNLEKIFKSPDDGYQYFFGYYDKSPLSLDGSKLLALQINFSDRMPGPQDEAKIGYFNLSDPKSSFTEVATTRAFNWQQGAMLQWVEDKNTKIIFNNFKNKKLISSIIDIKNTESRKDYTEGIYAVSPDSSYALSVDFKKHAGIRPGYSYAKNLFDTKDNSNEEEFIFYIDLKTGKKKPIISLKEINILFPHKLAHKSLIQYLESIMISPTGKKFAFLHRFRTHFGIFSRLFVSDFNGDNVRLVSESGRMGHFFWKNDNEILAYAGKPTFLNSLRQNFFFSTFFLEPTRKLIRTLSSNSSHPAPQSKIKKSITGDSYLIYNLKNYKVHLIESNFLNQDGHPSISPLDQDLMLSDTYPNSQGIYNFFLYHLKSKLYFKSKDFFASEEYANSPIRCDLHPKWSHCGKYVSVDALEDSKRVIELYYLDAEEN